MGASCDIRRPIGANAAQALAFSESQRVAAGASKKKGAAAAPAATTTAAASTPNLKSSSKSTASSKPNTLLTGLNKAVDQETPTEVVCPKPCANEGVCKNKKCYCKNGFAGVDCSSVLCPNDCNGRGECDVSTGTCLCSPPYIGKSCETASKNVK